MPLPSEVERIYPKTCRRAVTTAGTAEPLFDGVPRFYQVLSITIRADADNVGNIYLGATNRVSNTDYSYILAAGETVSLNAGQNWYGADRIIDAARMWIDSDNDGESLSFIALMAQEAW